MACRMENTIDLYRQPHGIAKVMGPAKSKALLGQVLTADIPMDCHNNWGWSRVNNEW